ncbi:hypothetical protein KEM56_006988 [Ascosphaera pollenicola]|nr:hypothetical protein KEM56_006988 [Ascosphaera pollenicola]
MSNEDEIDQENLNFLRLHPRASQPRRSSASRDRIRRLMMLDEDYAAMAESSTSRHRDSSRSPQPAYQVASRRQRAEHAQSPGSSIAANFGIPLPDFTSWMDSHSSGSDDIRTADYFPQTLLQLAAQSRDTRDSPRPRDGGNGASGSQQVTFNDSTGMTPPDVVQTRSRRSVLGSRTRGADTLTSGSVGRERILTIRRDDGGVLFSSSDAYAPVSLPYTQEAIRYLDRLRNPAFHRNPPDVKGKLALIQRRSSDFVMNTISIAPQVFCSWLHPGLSFEGSQHATHPPKEMDLRRRHHHHTHHSELGRRLAGYESVFTGPRLREPQMDFPTTSVNRPRPSAPGSYITNGRPVNARPSAPSSYIDDHRPRPSAGGGYIDLPTSIYNYRPSARGSYVFHDENGSRIPSDDGASDSQDTDQNTSTDHSEKWPVKVTIHDVNFRNMTLCGTMEAYNIPDKPLTNQNGTHIVTFLEGEIIDFNRHSLRTRNFNSNLEIDANYWHSLEPFKDMSDDEMTEKLLNEDYMKHKLGEKYLLMRWKERCFVSPSHERQGLTISGFYYICLRRSDGHIQGMYYDDGSSPYQLLNLDPAFKDGCMRSGKAWFLRSTVLHGFVALSSASHGDINLVDPLIGTTKGGHVFPGATLPFGMVKAGPDTDGENHGGFTPESTVVTGFSHMHDDGTGGGASMGNFPIFAQAACPDDDLDKCKFKQADRATPFINGTEGGSPGYFKITLDDSTVVEMTTTNRSALYRFTFDKSKQLYPLVLVDLIDLSHSRSNGSASIDPDTGRMTGNGTFAPSFGIGTYDMHFCIDFKNADLEKTGTFVNNRQSSSVKQFTLINPSDASMSAGLWAQFDEPKDDHLLVRVGISFISTQQACQNAEREQPDFDFESTVSAARAAWADKFSVISVDNEGISKDMQISFWSALYRSFISPQDYTGENPLWESEEPYYDSYYWYVINSNPVKPDNQLTDFSVFGIRSALSTLCST